MHDPNTLAFRPFGWLEIWHVDPCKNGDDDSAGWSTPKLTPDDSKNIDEVLKWNTDEKLWQKSGFEVIAWVWGRCVYQKIGRSRPLSLREIEYCLNLSANTIDNLDGPLTSARNSKNKEWLVICIYKAMLRHRRKWWQHPRWNFWRWRIYVNKPFRFSFGRSSGDSYQD